MVVTDAEWVLKANCINPSGIGDFRSCWSRIRLIWGKMWLFSRKGPSGFSSSSTSEDVTQGIYGTGLTAIVTGTSSGVGAETARVLASRGVHVIMLNKDMADGRGVQEAIVKEFPSAKVETVELDLSSLESVRRFGSEYNSSGRPLNLLINNAGIMATPFKLSEDKIELQFATNYLGHFLLTNLLLATMKKTANDSNIEGRIVNVASEMHRRSYAEGIRFDKINNESGYSAYAAYGQSKLALILHSNELTRRFKEEGVNITANSLHPGSVSTNLFHNTPFLKGLVNIAGKYVIKDVHQGAATTCYVALHPQVKGVSGEYFSDSNVGQASEKGKDAEMAKKLWDFSMNLVN